MARYPRDLEGYGAEPPKACWPNGAALAVQVSLWFEDGGEACILHGDPASEDYLTGVPGARAWQGQRSPAIESAFEYGARVGFWRLYRALTNARIPVTLYGVASALARAPRQVTAMQDAGWELSSLGLKSIDYKDFSEGAERAQMQEAIALHTDLTGQPPPGWAVARGTPNSVRLSAETGLISYTSSGFADELPYWDASDHAPHLILPQSLSANDACLVTGAGRSTAQQFGGMLCDSLDCLLAEGREGRAGLLSLTLRPRISGSPGNISALTRFLQHLQAQSDIWLATGAMIADHWRATNPSALCPHRPTTLSGRDFVHRFGEVFPQSPWIAEQAWEGELGPAHDTCAGLHAALVRRFRAASKAQRLAVLRAQTQSGAAAQLPEAEQAQLNGLFAAYESKHGFAFSCDTGIESGQALKCALERALSNSEEEEFAQACLRVESIARHKLDEVFQQPWDARN